MKPANRIVAIDGPAGAGKSTVARRLAERLGYVLLDTGALYRAVALAARDDGIPWDDEPAIVTLTRDLAADGALGLGPGPAVWLRARDVSADIRRPEISVAASRVSSYLGVREALLGLQRRLAERGSGVVAEGRDMGTVVFPDAAVKFFLTASLEVRASRRHDELRGRGHDVDLHTTRAEVAARDEQDMGREVAPLRRADDAVVVDSSDRPAEEVVDEMLEVVAARLG